MRTLRVVSDAGRTPYGQDHPLRCPRAFNEEVPGLIPRDVVCHHAVAVEVDVGRAIPILDERELELGIFTHDESLQDLAHSIATPGICITVSEPLEEDVEGHELTVSCLVEFAGLGVLRPVEREVGDGLPAGLPAGEVVTSFE